MEERSELIPKQNYNSSRRRFRNYYGKRKKKRSEPPDKEKVKLFRKERMFNIRTKNKGWRYKDPLKRKRFKEKANKKILIIYLRNQKCKNEEKIPIQMNPKMKIRKIIKRVMDEYQGIKVRTWRNPQKRLALAMLRNYFLLLSIKAPRTSELQEMYI
jgi:hypothetical protein